MPNSDEWEEKGSDIEQAEQEWYGNNDRFIDSQFVGELGREDRSHGDLRYAPPWLREKIRENFNTVRDRMKGIYEESYPETGMDHVQEMLQWGPRRLETEHLDDYMDEMGGEDIVKEMIDQFYDGMFTGPAGDDGDRSTVPLKQRMSQAFDDLQRDQRRAAMTGRLAKDKPLVPPGRLIPDDD